MRKTKVVVVGFGNLGRGVQQALKRCPDLELVQIISRDPRRAQREARGVEVGDYQCFTRDAEIAFLCGGSRQDLFAPAVPGRLPARISHPEELGQGPFFAQFFNTVDSFDTHARIPAYHHCMNKFAGQNRHTAVISAGWDPGTFSLERIMADAFIPGGRHYTFWGPGVSQGHSDAVRRIPGVEDARQYTLPVARAVSLVRAGRNPILSARQRHTRLVYVVAAAGSDRRGIMRAIKSMPHYFADYQTRVFFISREQMRKKHGQYPHAGFVLTSSEKNQHKALIEYRCQWDSNPEATARIMVACGRAVLKLNREKRYGAYTMADIPPAYYSPRSQLELLKNFM